MKITNDTGLKEHYEHHYLDDGSRVTVAMLEDPESGIRAMGFAICSPRDNFSRKYGRRASLGRAIKAYKVKHHISPIIPRKVVEYNAALQALYSEHQFKGMYFADGGV